LPNVEDPDEVHPAHPGKSAAAVERDGFNLHAGVRIEAGDDAGREKLCRYSASSCAALSGAMRAASLAMNSMGAMTRCLPRPRPTYFRRYASRPPGSRRSRSSDSGGLALAARARDPTDDGEDAEPSGQVALGL
jgi:hypothetical protein